MRVRARDVGGIEQGISMLLIHEIDENLPERFAAGDEFASVRFEGRSGGHRRKGDLKPFYAGRGQFARVEQVFDRQHFVTRLGAARQICLPRGLEQRRALPRAARNLAS